MYIFVVFCRVLYLSHGVKELEVRNGRGVVPRVLLTACQEKGAAQPVGRQQKKVDDAQHAGDAEADARRALEVSGGAVDGGVPVDKRTN